MPTKLTADDVAEIRRLYTLGLTTYELAVMFDVSQPNIWNIVTNRTWKPEGKKKPGRKPRQ